MRGPQIRSRFARDVTIVLFLLALLVLLAAEAASAAITNGPCPVDRNWAKIDGVTYTAANDTEADPIVVPAGETIEVEYNGRVNADITDHHGQVAIEIAGAPIVVGNPWENPNKPEPERKAHGFTSITIPNVPGVYDVTGFHEGTGGRCDGYALVKIEGNPVTTPAGAGALGGTAVAGGGLLAAAFARPRKGAV